MMNRVEISVSSSPLRAPGRDSSPTDSELLARARAGDDKAFGMLVTRYQSRVAATVLGMLGSRPEADDVGQEVFVRFYRKLDSFREESTLATYLTRIAINLSLNELKRKSRWTKLFSSTDDGQLPELPGEEDGSELDDRRIINKALSDLTPDHRAVVVLRLIDGYTTAETAEILKLPLGTVLSRLARAQEKLKNMLLPVYGERG